MKARPCSHQAIVLLLFTAIFICLSVFSSRRESATIDEPQHLTTGYVMLKLQDYRFDPEHPPLLRMWAALPLLAMDNIQLSTNTPAWHTGDEWTFAHQFLFKDNDANRLLFPARVMITLLGVGLGILVFCWARELFGFWPATIVLLLFCLEPNLMAHAGLVTTDIGAAFFIFGTVYFAWRAARQLSARNLTGLALFFVAAQLSKYSALLLIPIVFLILLLAKTHRSNFLTAFLVMAGLVLASYIGLWAIYDFRHAPTPDESEQAEFAVADKDTQNLPELAQIVRWADDRHLVPNACAQGFISMVAKTTERPAYLMGEYSDHGWWYYFPIAFLIKTPISLLMMTLVGLVLCGVAWKNQMADVLAILLPIAVYFAAATASHLNIGLRHILTIYPFILLVAGWTVAFLLGSSRSRTQVILIGLCLMQMVEFGMCYPDCLAFFNASIGGSEHGSEYLVDSNLDWGQGLISLKRWMKAKGVAHIGLSYFGNADPAYYGIEYTPFYGSSDFDPHTNRPLPEFFAISATNLRGAYFPESERNHYAFLQQQKPVAIVGHCIFVYRTRNDDSR